MPKYKVPNFYTNTIGSTLSFMLGQPKRRFLYLVYKNGWAHSGSDLPRGKGLLFSFNKSLENPILKRCFLRIIPELFKKLNQAQGLCFGGIHPIFLGTP
jgi:hypothetical protein